MEISMKVFNCATAWSTDKGEKSIGKSYKYLLQQLGSRIFGRNGFNLSTKSWCPQFYADRKKTKRKQNRKQKHLANRTENYICSWQFLHAPHPTAITTKKNKTPPTHHHQPLHENNQVMAHAPTFNLLNTYTPQVMVMLNISAHNWEHDCVCCSANFHFW